MSRPERCSRCGEHAPPHDEATAQSGEYVCEVCGPSIMEEADNVCPDCLCDDVSQADGLCLGCSQAAEDRKSTGRE